MLSDTNSETVILVRECTSILKLLPGENQTLLVRRNPGIIVGTLRRLKEDNQAVQLLVEELRHVWGYETPRCDSRVKVSSFRLARNLFQATKQLQGCVARRS